MSRRTTGIITAIVLVLIGAAVGYGINNVVSTRAPEEGLSEAQVGSVAERLIAARNELLLTPEEDNGDEDDKETKEQSPAADLLDGEPSGGITLSQGAITAERQTYRLIREHRRDLELSGTTYTEADLEVDVDSLTINAGTAIAIVNETTKFTGERSGKDLELEQNIVR
ncbi:MAG: hypothetical protein L0K86_25375, partial [Actinomycetia bacterium]|nr:hypothetical protein [Actinomycetes bacterium]